jgi:hypothetical protein
VVLVDDVQTLVDIIIINPILIDLVSHVALFHAVVMTIAARAKDGFYYNQYLLNMLFLLAISRSLRVCINMLTIFFIDVLTWHAKQKALEALFFQFYIHFIGRRCQ